MLKLEVQPLTQARLPDLHPERWSLDIAVLGLLLLVEFVILGDELLHQRIHHSRQVVGKSRRDQISVHYHRLDDQSWRITRGETAFEVMVDERDGTVQALEELKNVGRFLECRHDHQRARARRRGAPRPSRPLGPWPSVGVAPR